MGIINGFTPPTYVLGLPHASPWVPPASPWDVGHHASSCMQYEGGQHVHGRQTHEI